MHKTKSLTGLQPTSSSFQFYPTRLYRLGPIVFYSDANGVRYSKGTAQPTTGHYSLLRRRRRQLATIRLGLFPCGLRVYTSSAMQA